MSRLLSSGLAVSLLAAPVISQAAGFGIDATRLIYPQGQNSISVGVRNTGTDAPYLVQTQVIRTLEGAERSPFDALPPLFRLEANSTNQVRIMARDVSQLPSDRESIFYFRATAIPATQTQSANEQSQYAQGATRFGVGSSIKLFYRPSGLPGSSADAQRDLQFSRVGKDLRVTNPSPYFVSFASVSLNGKQLPLDTPQAKMLAPFASYSWKNAGARGSVKWATIGDEGGKNAFSQSLP